jgi:hypothetical protein
MSAVDVITKVLKANVLTPELTLVPTRGATLEEIRAEELVLGRGLCRDHSQLLQHWNGIALEVIRLFGCGPGAQTGRLAELQVQAIAANMDVTILGSDAAGFIYCQSRCGSITSVDSDGGGVRALAAGIDDLFERLVFGKDAGMFGGEHWLAELRSVGIVPN